MRGIYVHMVQQLPARMSLDVTGVFFSPRHQLSAWKSDVIKCLVSKLICLTIHGYIYHPSTFFFGLEEQAILVRPQKGNLSPPVREMEELTVNQHRSDVGKTHTKKNVCHNANVVTVPCGRGVRHSDRRIGRGPSFLFSATKSITLLLSSHCWLPWEKSVRGAEMGELLTAPFLECIERRVSRGLTRSMQLPARMSLDVTGVFFSPRHQLSAWKSGVIKCLGFWAKSSWPPTIEENSSLFDITIYTDCSQLETGLSGSGIAIYKDKILEKISLSHPRHLSVYKSEFSAIDTGLKDININSPSKIIIYFDSRAAIYTLQSYFSSQEPLLKSIAKSVSRLPANSSVTVQWLPAHVGIPGNELADSLAKAGALGLPEARESTTQLDERDLLRTIKTQCLQEWKSDATHDWYRAGGTSTGSNMENTCPFQGCSQTFSNTLEAMLHSTSCQFCLVDCPLSCGTKILRKDRSSHLSLSCQHLFGSCQFCWAVPTRDSLQQHEALCGQIGASPGQSVHSDSKNPQSCGLLDQGGTKEEPATVLQTTATTGCDVKCQDLENPVKLAEVGLDLRLGVQNWVPGVRVNDVDNNIMKYLNLEERAEALERRARENNLIIYGIESAETDSRELLLQKVKKLMAEDMQTTDDVVIAECHRLDRGPKVPILIEVPDHESRISLLKNSSKLRILNIFMSRDYSLQIREQRKILIEKRKELYKKGIGSKLRDIKLLLNGINYMVVEGQVVNAKGEPI
ncbi:hypothetical protein LAZ67_10002667 [Cordylochernes scorpioides]|uniref:ribonuclease H n=1 Tax=Cordylochernes scorpioides TaxID=51811 RepID=A0ABY6L0K6_9ARAC|nr:hypothetical protein LAZ67_10002667 [Cordylochernes scorpioides]